MWAPTVDRCMDAPRCGGDSGGSLAAARNLRRPELRLPDMGPLTRAVLFYDFAPVALEASAIDWEVEASRIVEQRLAAVAQRMIQDLRLRPPGPVVSELQGA